MGNSVVINLGHGNLYEGWNRVTAQLFTADRVLSEQFVGSLPPAPDLVKLYKNWQLIYLALCDRKRLYLTSVLEVDDELQIHEGGVTNVSIANFNELSDSLRNGINNLLASPGCLNISRQVRSALSLREEIQIILVTSDDMTRRLPWHLSDFCQDYRRAEVAVCRPNYKSISNSISPKFKRNKVRILAILGDSRELDLQAERNFLASLRDSEVVFLVNPTRQEFNLQLWDSKGWDILFFAGHSQTEGATGRIYINENKVNNSLTIEQLEEALKTAVEKGLKLAIFNSCDGLGLANSLEKLNIPTAILMREPVANFVAQEFFKSFLKAYAIERVPLFLAVQQARRQLQGLENDFPGASWLPIICQNPAVETPTWFNRGNSIYQGLFAACSFWK